MSVIFQESPILLLWLWIGFAILILAMVSLNKVLKKRNFDNTKIKAWIMISPFFLMWFSIGILFDKTIFTNDSIEFRRISQLSITKIEYRNIDKVSYFIKGRKNTKGGIDYHTNYRFYLKRNAYLDIPQGAFLGESKLYFEKMLFEKGIIYGNSK